mmetsp:Transcript_80425/g.126836  ORF Transcript_80425/g.126836 Transcript_80425/m.126836 type:complete len:127 (-) Transcript_80425:65-445(-)|eukprot:CAMPEP_0169066432 /NCGR_PEP_ID=MMETSP1015-20121227/2955_1 /TAXON_ID=342587 /ORGANISM="Karlodinium micrum, Strain CCMP2283" /LENGTH=126 /DNA_ID=CAMNT_0009125115 /DNA_START=68 /DNA_END=448 /DNA_ORIENTATION=-
MALITGGLGGLGLLAAKEMAAAWGTPIYTTSRSGRLADTRPEVMHMLDSVQQMSLHCACRCDASDGAAVTDLFAGVQRIPPSDLKESRRQAACQEESEEPAEVAAVSTEVGGSTTTSGANTTRAAT